ENEDVVAEFLQAHPEIRLVRETRRFPHRDGVPGGYFAVLDRAKVEDSEAGDPPDLRDRWEALRKGIRAIGEKGLVRDGLRKWDGTVDEYARAMDRKSVELAPEKDEKRKPLQNLE